MEYNWNAQTLRQDLKTLQKMLKEETNPTVKEKIVGYIAEVKALIIDNESIIKKRAIPKVNTENLLVLYKTVPYFELYYPFLEEFKNKLSKFFSSYKTPMLKEQKTTSSLSKDDIVELVHELFKSTNKEFFEAYSKLYAQKKTHIRFSEPRTKLEMKMPCIGGMLFIPGLNKQYVYIDNFNPKKDKNDTLSTLTHEEGHAISSIINPDRYFSDHSFFTEIESIFFELIGYDFYARELNDKSFMITALSFLEGSYYEADYAIDKENLARRLFDLGNPIDSHLTFEDQRLQNTYMDVLNDSEIADEEQIEHEIKYTFSNLIAIELYEIYQEDKDLALHLLSQIIKRNRDDSEYQNVTSLVTPTKRLVRYKDRLLNSIK